MNNRSNVSGFHAASGTPAQNCTPEFKHKYRGVRTNKQRQHKIQNGTNKFKKFNKQDHSTYKSKFKTKTRQIQRRPKILTEFFEAVKDVPQERIPERTETSSQDHPLQRTVELTQIMEEEFEVLKIVLQERILETVEAVVLVSRERVQQLTAEQIGNVPQFREETVDEISQVPRERAQQWTAEQNGELHQFREKTARKVSR